MRLKKTINKTSIRSGKLVGFSSDRKNTSFVFSGKNKPIYFNRPQATTIEPVVFIKTFPSIPFFVKDIVISSNVNNFNLKNKLIELGWDENLPIKTTVTIQSDVTIGSTSADIPAFSVEFFPKYSAKDEDFFSTVKIVNNGKIQGAGGRGGGGTYNSYTRPAQKGGTALAVDTFNIYIFEPTFTIVTIENNGQIWGGGGGGGGFGAYDNFMSITIATGGGGGAGTVPGAGGDATAMLARDGSAGTAISGGAAGYSGAGRGGDPGLPGGNASGGNRYNGTGGAAGNYIWGSGWTPLIWVTKGDLRGLEE